MSYKKKSYNNSGAQQLLGEDDPKKIIFELLNGLNKKLESTILNIDKKKLNIAKEDAKKAQNIAFALRRSLDRQNGGEIADNLDFLYGHIHFATDKFIKNNKNDFIDSAFYISSEILSGWKGLVEKTA